MDVHREQMLRGYLAMLVVEKPYRSLGAGAMCAHQCLGCKLIVNAPAHVCLHCLCMGGTRCATPAFHHVLLVNAC